MPEKAVSFVFSICWWRNKFANESGVQRKVRQRKWERL